jgi:hypothetical protein
MPRTKNVSALGGGDDEDPRRPFRQVKGKTVHLEQQEGRKKRRMDRAARAAAAAAAAAAQAELGDQPQTPSDQIVYRVRRLASRPRSSTHTTASTPPPTLHAPVTPVAPSTTTAIPATSTTPASTAPPPTPASLLLSLHLDSRSAMRLRYDHLLWILDFLTFSVLQQHRYVGSDTYPWSLGYRLRWTLLQLIFSAPVFRSHFSELRCLHRLLCECTDFWIFQLFCLPPVLTLRCTCGG